MKYYLNHSEYDANDEAEGLLEALLEHIFPYVPSKTVTIDMFEVLEPYRNMGLGTLYLKNFVARFNNSTLICVEANELDDSVENVFDGDTDAFLASLSSFYSRCGFSDVTDQVGFEDSRYLIYTGNDTGKHVLDLINK